MKRIITGFFIVLLVAPMIGWGSNYENKADRQLEQDQGEKQADNERQGNDEDIKRTQGDESGRRDINIRGSLQDDERGRF